MIAKDCWVVFVAVVRLADEVEMSGLWWLVWEFW